MPFEHSIFRYWTTCEPQTVFVPVEVEVEVLVPRSLMPMLVPTLTTLMLLIIIGIGIGDGAVRKGMRLTCSPRRSTTANF